MADGNLTRARRRRDGLCMDCGGERAAGRMRCEGCLRSLADKALAERDGRKAKGLCIAGGCRRRAAEGRVRCRIHLREMRARQRDRSARRAAKGLCRGCPNPALPDRSRCEPCTARDREARKRRAADFGSFLDACYGPMIR